MKKLQGLTNVFIEDKKTRILKFRDSLSDVWKRTRDGPSLRRTCSESFLCGGDWPQRFKNLNKAEVAPGYTSYTSETLRRKTVKVEHYNGIVRPSITELIPVKSCLRRVEQQDSNSTPSPASRRVTFSIYALILSSASQNSVTELQELLDRKPLYINKPSSSGETALHKAAAKGNLDCVKLLVKRGANVNIVDKLGRTPLLIAWENGHFECHKCMLTSLKVKHRD